MKLLHVTNIVSPHQLPLARYLAAQLGPDNYRYAATAPQIPERLAMGWTCDDQEPWILRPGEGQRETDVEQYRRWWSDADLVLCGDRALGLMAERASSGKLTFYMSERWWKPPLGMARLAHPRFARMALAFRQLARSPHCHYLPMGLHAATDMRRWARFDARCWLWGYFTALPERIDPPAARVDALELLYAGRMLGWKRVDTLIRAFATLSRDAKARLTLIGNGPRRLDHERLAQRLRLAGRVVFHDSLPMAEIWRRMRSTHVYVLPSNGYEGWGAVVNEAMSQGCAVVASTGAGAARTMIRHEQNGLLFRPGDWRQLAMQLRSLYLDEPGRQRLARAGQSTIVEEWSPKIGAERLLAVGEALLSGDEPCSYESGPMRRLRHAHRHAPA